MAAGSRRAVNGKCPAGFFYLPPQDNGPPLCIPEQGTSSSTTTSATTG
jgi:hypothetical protein